MIAFPEFARGFGVIALHLAARLTDEHHVAYFAALADETDAGEWEAFSRIAVKRFGWRAHVVPTVPQLVDALREFRGAPALEGEAVAAYERVIAAGVYTPEGGTSWSYRGVLAACGRAAADAFLEAGGHHAFASSWRESERRERFVEAYRESARTLPTERLLPAAPAPALLPAHEPVSRQTAGEVLRKLAAMVGGTRPVQPARKPIPESEYAARVESLRRQAEEIQR